MLTTFIHFIALIPLISQTILLGWVSIFLQYGPCLISSFHVGILVKKKKKRKLLIFFPWLDYSTDDLTTLWGNRKVRICRKFISGYSVSLKRNLPDFTLGNRRLIAVIWKLKKGRYKWTYLQKYSHWCRK